MAVPSTLLTTEQAAEILGLTPRFLQVRRLRGDGPAFIRISSNCVRYRSEDLEAWLDERVRRSTSGEIE